MQNQQKESQCIHGTVLNAKATNLLDKPKCVLKHIFGVILI